MYAYFGIRRIRSVLAVGAGVAVCTVVLVNAVIPGGSGGHVAAWMGVSTDDAHNWLQAGIYKQEGDKTPFEYIEIGRRGRQVSLRTWPTTLGHKARIVLRHRYQDKLWRIVIDTHASRWVWLPHAHVNNLALLETYTQGGGVHGTAVINGKRTHG